MTWQRVDRLVRTVEQALASRPKPCCSDGRRNMMIFFTMLLCQFPRLTLVRRNNMALSRLSKAVAGWRCRAHHARVAPCISTFKNAGWHYYFREISLKSLAIIVFALCNSKKDGSRTPVIRPLNWATAPALIRPKQCNHG